MLAPFMHFQHPYMAGCYAGPKGVAKTTAPHIFSSTLCSKNSASSIDCLPNPYKTTVKMIIAIYDTYVDVKLDIGCSVTIYKQNSWW